MDGQKSSDGQLKGSRQQAYLQDKSSFGSLSLSHLDGAKKSNFTRAQASQQEIVFRRA